MRIKHNEISELKRRYIFCLNFIKIHVFELKTSGFTKGSSQLGLGYSLLLK